MRSFVCGQCHVEYYFKGPEKRLTYPWHKGLNVDFVESENSNGFHAPQEATRILGEAIDSARKGQLALPPLPSVARR